MNTEETKQLTAQHLALFLGQEAITTAPSYDDPEVGIMDIVNLDRDEISINTEGGYYLCSPSETKLLLRPLSDMSEEELRDVFPGESRPEAYTTEFWKSHLKEYGVPTLKPEQFTYLLSRGFDLFGYIESGLALDKTNI